MTFASHRTIRPLLVLTLVVALGSAVGCGDANLTTSGITPDNGPSDAASDSVVDAPPDTESDGDNLDADTTEDTAVGGAFLEPCERDRDCLSNFCIQVEDQLLCSEFCNETSCPDGWSCRLIENAGADVARICVPNPSTLCGQCDNNTDCGGQGATCITVGGRRVCGKSCEFDEDCPDEYLCSLREDQAGGQSRQCVPETEQCSCNVDDDGSERSCVRQNQFGACAGVEVCLGTEGWSACTAPIPAEDICDGIDNDCDGARDENLTPKPCTSTPNEIGTCEGTERCEGDDGWVCDARVAAIEICDGLDNDCNGIADDGLCFDGNPCTFDVCDPEGGGCNYPPRAGACDDEDACTRDTICVAGACTGSMVNCNDNNECTSDTCDRVAGCQHSPLTGATCETGNFCTNDFCQSGSCVTGAARSCGSSSQCQTAGCNPATGCTVVNSSGPCNDDDACTVNDFCAGGSCQGGSSACTGQCTSECGGISFNGLCVEVFGSPVCTCICL